MIATPTELTYFLEIFRTEHLSRAALKLAISQPTLTQSLGNLEKKTGSKLFHRTKKGMVATDDGKQFYIRAQALIESWKNLENNMRVSREGLQGKFKVGCHQSVAAYCAPLLIKRLEKIAPRIELELVHDFSRKVIEKIVSYEIDLGFVVNPVKHPDLILKPIGVDTVSFWIAKNTPVTLPQKIFCDLSGGQSEMLLRKSEKKFFPHWTIVQSSSLEVVRALTLSGLGIGILPQRVALAENAAILPYKANLLPKCEDTIYLAYRKDALTSQAAQTLLEAARIEL